VTRLQIVDGELVLGLGLSQLERHVDVLACGRDRTLSGAKGIARPAMRVSLTGPVVWLRAMSERALRAICLGVVMLACTIGGGPRRALAAEPIRLHPDNPHYFLFRGKPMVLIAAGEHYGSVMNRPFDFEKYLADHAAKRQTVTRTFVLYRELQSAKNPWSPCKPESPDYIAPWVRVDARGDVGKEALDGLGKYDLDRWNPEFFDRLYRFLRRASELGVVVELTLFSNSYNDKIFELNPLNPANNVQGIGPTHWARYLTLKEPKLLERQVDFARKIVGETAGKYDNVYYEVCNEPGGDWPPESTLADVDAWQARIACAVREEMKRVGGVHLVAGSPAFSIKPRVRQAFDAVAKGELFDVINFHSHPDNYLGGKQYDLGRFMAKDLALRTLGDFCADLQAAAPRKPFVLDEDNAASAHKDEEAWTIDRKRAWATVLSGGHYDFIDFSITVGHETGTLESNAKLRTWMKHLSTFVHSFDFVHAEPNRGWVGEIPRDVFAASLARAGEDYVAYFADARERRDPRAGAPIKMTLSLMLPPGDFVGRFYSPTSGTYSAAEVALQGGPAAGARIEVPGFVHDVALRVTRRRQR
jgi:hypothetical protein